MASESIYRFGEVVLVPFPFSDQTASKKRPAVVVSSAAYHANRADSLIIAITSQARTTLDFATFPVADWQAAGLLKPSFAKPALTTLEQMLVIRRMGHLSLGDQHSLHQMLTQILG